MQPAAGSVNDRDIIKEALVRAEVEIPLLFDRFIKKTTAVSLWCLKIIALTYNSYLKLV